MMAAVPQKDTRPELLLRKLAHRLGYRYRLHGKNLPGSPDIVFASRRKVIFVHGCFWHRHSCRTGQRAVKTRPDFWEAKFLRNQARDIRNEKDLEQMDWQSLVFWECELHDLETVTQKLVLFLNSPSPAKTSIAGHA